MRFMSLKYYLILLRSLEPRWALKWGTKKRRSRLDYHKTDIGVQRTSPQSTAAASPVTPLAFFSSESEGQRSKNLFKKTSKKMEIVKVTNYCNKLMARNSQLKAMKQEVLNSWPRKEEPKLETFPSMGGNLAMKLIPKNDETSVDHFHTSFGSGLLGPFWIPVARIFAHDRRTRFAEARRRRMDILRVKSSKFPRTR